ncbi:hypothetical protein [Pseudoxanthomonas mexicana]|uniref:hypothetical protein n=1 Tax=Pseudoxanthomonas mexicana TaxID=128785 RepID=UPI00209FDA19|nr:hypothetical protein [Pseudoxanthomonas mexicana]MCP1584396.1 hypothetical protein [Pseudoxanthomonas mexicana]
MTANHKQFPRLTVRAAAEMLHKPPELMRQMLYDQKYPDQGDRPFRTPYYRHAIAGMKNYFRSGRPALLVSKSEIQGFRQPSRIENNFRVLDAFEKSSLAVRPIQIAPNRRLYANVGGVELRLSSDMQAVEDGETRVFYFNCRNHAYDPETARRMVEIAYWVMTQNGINVRPNQVEFDDLFTGKVYRVEGLRSETLTSLDMEASAVRSLWDEL